jgi:hypothetical protein
MILDGSIRRSNSFGANDGQVSRTTKIATNRSPKSRLTRFAGTVYVGRLSPLRNRASFCLGRRTNSDSLAKVGAPLGVALPKPGRVDQDKMECVKFPKGCHRHSASARTVHCTGPKQRLATCAAARHNFRSIPRGIHLLTPSLLRVAGASVFSTSCDTGISRIPSSWPLASARLNARQACQKQR